MLPPTASVPLGVAVSLIAVGGAAGALLRWAAGSAFPTASTAFPWTTFAINVTGSLLLALLPTLLTTAADRSGRLSARFDALLGLELRKGLGPGLGLLLGPGLLGGFTTLSATSEEARVLIAAGHGLLASAYLVGTLGAALAAVHAVGWLTRRQREAGRR